MQLFFIKFILVLVTFTIASFYGPNLVRAALRFDPVKSAFAQVGTKCPPPNGPTTALADGLISAVGSITGFSTTSGACIQNNPSAAFDPSKHITKYATLVEKYYTKSTSSDKKPASNTLGQGSGTNVFQGDHIYHVTNTPASDIVLSAISNGQGVQLIFIDGNLRFNGNFEPKNGGNSDPNGGTVFVVQGDIFIDKNVTLINAVLMGYSNIYTAYESPTNSCTTSTKVPSQPLTINGSLISLKEVIPAVPPAPSPEPPIKLCRTLTNNTAPAELIQLQPKYSVILKDTFADDLIITLEE